MKERNDCLTSINLITANQNKSNIMIISFLSLNSQEKKILTHLNI